MDNKETEESHKTNIFLFAGTTEGREIADAIRKKNDLGRPWLDTRVYSATAYGSSLVQDSPSVKNVSGRLDGPAMEKEFRQFASENALVVDATHPYATEVTANLRRAASSANLRYVRIRRTEDKISCRTAAVKEVGDCAEAVSFLRATSGNILVTTGSKELKEFTALPDYQNRIYARVLPLPAVIGQCVDLGITGQHLIAMQGPFSEEMNIALIHSTNAVWMVTKESGKAGGYEEKLSAAEKTGCHVVAVRRPREQGSSVSAEEFIRSLDQIKEEMGY